MKIYNKETNKEYRIDNYDGDCNTPDYMGDVVSIDENIKYNNKTERYESDPETIEWWIGYRDGMEKAMGAVREIQEKLSDKYPATEEGYEDYYNEKQAFLSEISDACGSDYGQHADLILQVCSEWEKEL